MAEFILGNPLRKVARRRPWLRRALWRLDYVLVWSLVRAFSLLPVDFASRLGERAGRLIGPRLKHKSAILRENMHIAFPEKPDSELDQLVLDAWGRAGRVLAEYPHLDKILRDDDRLEIDILEPVATYSDPGSPCVFVAAHVSNWEIACLSVAKLGIPYTGLYSPPTNPLLDEMLAESRRPLNCELVPRDNSARLLLRSLKQGRTIGMVADRRIDGGSPICFFGRDKLSSLLPAKLALKTGCPLVLGRVQRRGDARYRVTLQPPIRPRDPGADETEQVRDMTEQMHVHFEDWIRAEPADWFCSKRMWEKQDSPGAMAAGNTEDGDGSRAA